MNWKIKLLRFIGRYVGVTILFIGVGVFINWAFLPRIPKIPIKSMVEIKSRADGPAKKSTKVDQDGLVWVVWTGPGWVKKADVRWFMADGDPSDQYYWLAPGDVLQVQMLNMNKTDDN